MSAPDAPPITLVTGPEELLVERAIADVVARVRASDAGADVRDLPAGTLAPGGFDEVVSPSLFGERRVVVVRGADSLGEQVAADIAAYLHAPADDVALVLVHRGGARGKALLAAARASGAHEIACAEVRKVGEKMEFVRAEFARAGRQVSPEALRALVDALGSDLREMAAACSQLVADTTGPVDEAAVDRYHGGRVEATGFSVADRAIEGRTAEALVQLRHALAVGVAPVLVTSALATGLRTLARVAGSPRQARPADLARDLGIAPWQVDKARRQLTGWTPDGVARAVQAVAEADAQVKGSGDDPAYALERAVVTVSRARER